MVKSNIRCKDCIHCYGMNPPLNDRGRCSLVETEPNYVDTNMLWLCKIGFESNIRNPYQGEFRTSVLDISLLEYAIKKSNIDIQNTWLFITCLDIVKGWYRYTYKGKLYTPNNEDYFVKEISDILCIRNVLGSYGPSAKDVKVLKEV